MNIKHSVTIKNPELNSEFNALWGRYGNIGNDVSKCLHQVYQFVKGKVQSENLYSLKSNDNLISEELRITNKTGSTFEIKIVELEDKEIIISTPLSSSRILNVYDGFMMSTLDEELKKLSIFYKVFIMSISTGHIFGDILQDDKTLIIHIGKYDTTGQAVMIGIKITKA